MVDPASVSVGLLINLVSSALWSGAEEGREWYIDQQRRKAISEHLGDLPTEFNRALKQRMEEAAFDEGHDALAKVALRWDDEIATELDSLNTYFGNEETGVQRVTDAFLDGVGEEMDKQAREEVAKIVADEYQNSVANFEENVAEADLTGELNRELLKQLSERVRSQTDETLDRLDELKRRNPIQRNYRLFDADTERSAAAEHLLDTVYVEFVDRPAAAGGVDPGGTLVVGPSGSGKTRVLVALVERLDEGSVEHVLVPDDGLMYPSDTDAFYQDRGRFDGDVLLVWDDLHEVNRGEDNAVVAKMIADLQSVLDEEGHDLRVLGAVQSGRIDDVIDKAVNRFEEYRHLGDIDVDDLEHIANELASEYEITTEDGATRALAERVAGEGAPSGPGYVEAALLTTDDGYLSIGDIKSLPTTAEDVWAAEYAQLKRADDPRRRYAQRVLVSMKLLHDVGMPPFRSLVRGVFREVLGAGEDRLDFKHAVEALNSWQWVGVPEGEDTDRRAFDIHDLQVEAVDQSYDWDLCRSMSEYLSEDANTDGLPEPVTSAGVNGIFATNLPDQFWEFKNKHFQFSISAAEESGDDAIAGMCHVNYAIGLHYRGDTRQAAKHFACALQLQYDDPDAHYNYAILLGSRGDARQAARHYAHALQLQYDDPDVHTSYAAFLHKRGDARQAAKHFDRALKLQHDHPDAHYNYANLLNKLGYPRRAARHYAHALQLQYDDIDAQINYATLLGKRGDTRRAAKHFARALQLQYDNPGAHTSYANLLHHRGDTRRAARHYAHALQFDQDPHDPTIHYDYSPHTAHTNYATLLDKRDDTRRAAKHFARALQLQYYDSRTHHNYAVFLDSRGDSEKATIHAARAAQLRGDSTRAAIHLAAAHLDN